MPCVSDEDLCALIEGRLPSDETVAMHGHLESCATCLQVCVALGRSLAPVMPALGEGQRLGRYVLGRRLGQGGMGMVFAAKDSKLNRAVAIKVVAPHALGEQALARFAREARAAGALDHPNVCAVLDVEDDPACPYLVLALVDGETLRDRRARGVLGLDEMLGILTQLCAGLAAAHAAGVVHRDIKPSNVMLTPSGQVKILDFGLARLQGTDSESLTQTGDVLGTVAYMAPEQHRGDTVDARADVWAVGVIACEMLAGPPFGGGTPASLAAAVLSDEPRLPPSLPPGLRAVLATCLDKDPARRYPTAAELGADLARMAAGSAVRARPPGALSRLFRRRWRAIAAVTVLVAAMVATGMFILRQRQQAARRAELAGRVGRAVQEMQGRIRNAHLMPIHDISPEQDAVRAQIDEVEAARAVLGAEGRGPIEYALAEGYLALDDPFASLPHFRAAWDAGERGANLEASFGLALGRAYSTQLSLVVSTPVGPAREEMRKKAATELRDPAIVHLRAASGHADLPADYVEAVIARYEHNYARAAELAHRAFAKAPLFYEAGRVEADSMSRLADEAFIGAQAERQADRQTDRQEKLALFDQADRAYEPVVEIGRSDASVYVARANSLILSDVRAASGDNERLERARVQLDTALRIEPKNAGIVAVSAEVYGRLAENMLAKGQSPRPMLEKSIALLERVRADDHTRGSVEEQIGNAWSILVDDAIARGDDPRQELDNAVAAYKRAIVQRPDVDRYDNMGLTLCNYAQMRSHRGVDPMPMYTDALAAADNALALGDSDKPDQSWRRRSQTLDAMAEWIAQRGGDPTPKLDLADEAIDKAMALDASVASTWATRAWHWWLRGRWLLRTGHDASAAPGKILDAAKEAAVRDPGDSYCDVLMARAQLLTAEMAIATGRDPTAAVAAAAARIATARQKNPKWAEPSEVLAEAQLVAAHWAQRQHHSPAVALDAAERATGDALAINPHTPLALLWAAEVHRRRAEWLPATRAVELPRGLSAVEIALGESKDLAEARLVRAALRRLTTPPDSRAATETAAVLAENPPLSSSLLNH